MIKLDKNYAYYLSELNEEQIKQVAEFVFENKHEKLKQLIKLLS